MNIKSFLNMDSSEKMFILIIIGLILLLILFYIKYKNSTKRTISYKVDVPETTTVVEPITVPVEPAKTEENSKLELEHVLAQMHNDLNEQEDDSVQLFEDEQEKKSIISYQELLKVNQNDEPLEKEVVEPIKTEETTDNLSSKFRNSEFISPIYGRIDNDMEYPTIPKIRRAKLNDNVDVKDQVIEKPEIIPIDIVEIKEEQPLPSKLETEAVVDQNKKEEIHKNEKFLKTLRDFRKNLE